MEPIHIATGQLPDSEGTLYTVPGSTKIILTNVSLVNDSANPNQDVSIMIDRSGSSLLLFGGVLEAEKSRIQWSGMLVLDAGDEILGVSSDATSVNYFLDGYEV